MTTGDGSTASSARLLPLVGKRGLHDNLCNPSKSLCAVGHIAAAGSCRRCAGHKPVLGACAGAWCCPVHWVLALMSVCAP